MVTVDLIFSVLGLIGTFSLKTDEVDHKVSSVNGMRKYMVQVLPFFFLVLVYLQHHSLLERSLLIASSFQMFYCNYIKLIPKFSE